MNPESELVLAIAKGVVYNKQKDRVIPSLIKNGNINWSRFKDELSYHGLVCFAYLWLKDFFSLLPEDLIESLSATYYYYLKHASYLEQEFLTLYSLFKDKGIVLIPIKGVALLEDLYLEYPIRASSDIDVLVQEKDLGRANVILEESGFQKHLEGLKESYWREKQYHFVFTRRDSNNLSLIVELHWDLDYRRKRGQLLPGMFGRLREFVMCDREIKLLSPEDTFFALALHQRRFGKTLCLRDVCDMARLLDKYASIFDWDYLLKESRKSKVCTTIFFALYQVNFLFGLNIPEYVWRGLNLSTWKKKIIQRFIEKNTFLAGQNTQAKNLYLKAHFLLYDNLWEPIDYILNIPPEQFAKYYGLKTYDKKTEFLYKNRLFYIPLKAVLNVISRRNQR